jgi:hypothetical protein
MEINIFLKFGTENEFHRDSRREGGEAVIFTGARTSKGSPREQNLPLFKSYLKNFTGARVKSTILSTALHRENKIGIKENSKIILNMEFNLVNTGSI